MSKKNKGLTRANVYSLAQKCKHRFNSNYSRYISMLTPLQKGKLKLLCDRHNTEPYKLRDREFALVSTNKITTKFFKRARKHRELYDSYDLVLRQPT